MRGSGRARRAEENSRQFKHFKPPFIRPIAFLREARVRLTADEEQQEASDEPAELAARAIHLLLCRGASPRAVGNRSSFLPGLVHDCLIAGENH